MYHRTDDLRIQELRPLLPPAILMEELPLSEEGSTTIVTAREQISRILHGEDDRLVVVVGPCSIHDPVASLEYARRLQKVAEDHKHELLIVMRVYFEKPRTTVGWKGLINDPHLDGTFDINLGLRTARQLLQNIVDLGLGTGTEYLDPISPQYYGDLVCWGAIGARTTESQIHRQLASGLSCPVGFKNRTDGDLQVAVDAMVAARAPHAFV
ncbi:MAG: 3-deoxy-7-phosphoheptulonate synthase, partial [Proteobacteria bacterium]|nr:3-deoxy-7-phosphoheptulonate synthase [Pseudomonadota bacterium]